MVECLCCSTRIRVQASVSSSMEWSSISHSRLICLEWLIRTMLIYHQLIRWIEEVQDTAVRKKKKTIETDCMWIQIITAVGFKRWLSLWEVIIIIIIIWNIIRESIRLSRTMSDIETLVRKLFFYLIFSFYSASSKTSKSNFLVHFVKLVKR